MISTRLSKYQHENNCEKTTSQTYCYQDGFPKQCDSIWNRRSSNTTRYESSFFKYDSIYIVVLQMRLDMNRRSSNTTRYESRVEMKQYNEESSPNSNADEMETITMTNDVIVPNSQDSTYSSSLYSQDSTYSSSLSMIALVGYWCGIWHTHLRSTK